jgi:hypothetical protein
MYQRKAKDKMQIFSVQVTPMRLKSHILYLYMGDSTSTTSTEKIEIETLRKFHNPIPYKYMRSLSYMATQGPTGTCPQSYSISPLRFPSSRSLENQIMNLPGSRCDRAFKVFGMAT